MTQCNFLDRLPSEAYDFTPTELAEAEKIYQAHLCKHPEAFATDKTGKLKDIYIKMAVSDVIKHRKSRQVQLELDLKPVQSIKPPIPTTPTPTAPVPEKPKPPAEKPKKAEVIQLEFNFPERARPVSNATVRAALFAAVQGENREFFNKVTLASQSGIEIIFTGQQLNQDDHDVFMQLVYMANYKPLGGDISVPANAILAELGRGNGKSQHEQLKNEIHRLVTGTVNIKFNGINFIGHLIDYAVQDEKLLPQKRHWTYQLNPRIAALFGRSQYTQIDWEQRKQLKQKELARWLHSYIASHSTPFPVSVEFLRNISGSKTRELWKFRENLKKALEALLEIGFITNWHIDKETDLVTIERLASVTQLHFEPKSTPELPAPPVAYHYGDRHLEPSTIEKFRHLCPRLDAYACKADFDIWLKGKTPPKSYDAAFLGFAKKWAKGKF